MPLPPKPVDRVETSTPQAQVDFFKGILTEGTGGGDGGGGWKDSFGEWWTCNPNDHAAGMDDAEWAHFITSAEWKRRHSGELRAERDRWKNNRGQARSRARKGDSGKVARRQAEAASREAKRQRMAADAADALCGMGGQ